MSTATYIHLNHLTTPVVGLLPKAGTDCLLLRDAVDTDVTLFLGVDDETRVENALRLIEALQEMRERALRRMALREATDPDDEPMLREGIPEFNGAYGVTS